MVNLILLTITEKGKPWYTSKGLPSNISHENRTGATPQTDWISGEGEKKEIPQPKNRRKERVIINTPERKNERNYSILQHFSTPWKSDSSA